MKRKAYIEPERIYLIDNIEFRLKENFTLDEKKYLLAFLDKAAANLNKNNIVMLEKFSYKKLINFLSIVLEQVEDRTLHKNFEMGEISWSMLKEIFDDFLHNVPMKKLKTHKPIDNSINTEKEFDTIQENIIKKFKNIGFDLN